MERIFEVDPWQIVTHQLDRKHKRLQESMTSIGNGYMGMRGVFEEDYSGDSLPGIYLGGVWYPDKTVVGWWKNGYPDYFGKVINAINFIKTNLKIDGQAVDLGKDEVTAFKLALDMHNGVLTRQFIVTKNNKQVQVTIERFVSIVQKELCALRYTVENLASEAVEIEISSMIDADVQNEDANYGEQFWQVIEQSDAADDTYLVGKTMPNDFGVPRFSVGVQIDHQTTMMADTGLQEAHQVGQRFKQQLAPKTQLNFEKRAVVVTSRDYSELDLVPNMQRIKQVVAQQSYQQLLAAQTNQWAKRWQMADVVIVGDDSAQQGIRFNLFQLFSTFYGEDERLNIGPKGFTGEKYGGATYWDTEGFAMPLYLSLADPKVSLNLLKYRHNQLSGAEHNARQQGLKGALYPMVTFNGIENHNEWEITFEEIHRNGTIAYAIYNYTRYTGDETYLLNEGIEVLTEIARFWADRVHFSQRAQRYMIHGVTGPNEYENNINNNWYTNLLAQWTLSYTIETLKKVSDTKKADLRLSDAELSQWQAIIEKMYLPQDEQLGIFLQQDGFLDKDIQPVSAIPADQRPINQHWSWDKILRSPYIKQADVLQGIWYFMDRFSAAEKKRNFDFYETLTVHESSLSAAVHAILAADLHYEDKAVEMYARTARLDLDNYNNDTDDGLHITSMTGSWLAIVQGFAGMRISDEGQLSFKPFLPKKWTAYEFHINFRGRLLKISVTADRTDIKLLKGDRLAIQVNDASMMLE
ncbi:glycoside hydrolase family 65 protein [Latilactobacillus curvatus]|uniref:glycoside hydrolase family 65 protein n=1 Tax=Latilactobacillus curvatus TaxID=28038 RepID=UPI0009765486|nr:glycoside hydrolase family 65 protein [Latilactobacillus curvatus]MCT1216526.1 glycoside hydrolase family 65 protein [Latilactobacillus curvatus]MCT3525476.1 glycoside hydrolase family 65 protein [Latilactobacillus curvatus]MCT3529243.1 glycoside hydrolase family 65 protein [Latilactobacillus curvatus]MCW8780008.1 glycoside hydrolase family 65 protein [Latilactobacillus curvatus]MDG2983164.1 glycoside hydrolase family 65 protein [Latilactobacillus curvatus]